MIPCLTRLHRVSLTLLVGALLGTTAISGASANAHSSQLAQAVQAAQAALAQAQAKAAQESTALGAAQQQLTTEQNSLVALQSQSAALTTKIAVGKAQLVTLNAILQTDKERVGAYLSHEYEAGTQAPLLYVLASDNISTFVDRQQTVNMVSGAANGLIQQVEHDQSQAQLELAQEQQEQQTLTIDQERAATTAVMLQAAAESVQQAAAVAQTQVQTSASGVNAAQTQQQQYQQQLRAEEEAAKLAAQQEAAAQAQQAAAASSADFPPVPGATFSITTNLTQNTQLTATEINQFLAGTNLQNLGSAYIQAQTLYHVNARYLVAHSIEESDWGLSAIAENKDNLFGFEAYDRNPYANAMNFTNMTIDGQTGDAACILYVASYVATNYLSPKGPYYHGATLEGMNVAYATDPNWGTNIANIGDTIPPGGS